MADEFLGREIRQLRTDIKDDFAEVREDVQELKQEFRSAVAGLLPRELYTAHYEGIVRRQDAQEARMDTLTTKIESIDKDRQETWRKRVSTYWFPTLTVLLFVVFQFWKP